MAGTLNVDTLKADSNLRLQIASANVAFIDVNGLTIVGNSLNVGGGRISVTSNNSISTPSVIGANLVTATGTTALGITANGQITTANAPFILTGGQIKFPATKLASADANTLDDYEEGTFTYTLPCSTSGSFTVRNIYTSGYYTKVGRVVTININFESSGSSSPVGNLQFAGLPFATANNPSGGQNNMWIPIIVRGTTGTIASFYLYFGANTTTGTFTYQDTSGTFNNLAVANISSGASGYIEGSIQFSYPIN